MNELEAPFSIKELFFSKTDLKGIILTGNNVFLRVSEYSGEELIKKPHNTIRHADIPRSVFKLFWSFLGAKKPIAAYVKNRSKTGRYYWVFAMAFPMSDGYLSVRLKPSSKFFPIVKQVYAAALEMEKAGHSMEDGITFILEQLKGLGFESYDDFMKTALIEELQSRDHELAAEASSSSGLLEHTNGQLKNMLSSSAHCMATAKTAFCKSSHLSKITDDLVNTTQEIQGIAHNVKLVTTNLTISSSKLGEQGKPLAMVSINLERLCLEIVQSSTGFKEAFTIFQKSVTDMHFAIAVSRFQMEVTHQFVEEMIQHQGSDFSDLEQHSLQANCADLRTLIADNLKTVETTVNKLIRDTKVLLQAIGTLSKVTAGMDVICVVGKIEMARIVDLSSSLAARLKDMEDLTASFKRSLRQIESECQGGLAHSEHLNELFISISANLRMAGDLVSAA